VRRLVKLVFASCVFFATSNQAMAATCAADKFIADIGSAFMNAAQARSAAAFAGAAGRYADLHAIALFALGPYRKNLPRAREAEYVAQTKKFMGRFMAGYASKFNGDAISITSCAGYGPGLLVNTKLSTGQGLTFRLRKAGSSFRVEDVSISSIWLAQTLRSKFTGVMRDNGGDVSALMSWMGN
jgi:phospholipid transport system substrate-binding protein